VTDLLIVGGGPAGLAVAIRARQAGLAATVLDRSRPPIDKPCGEGLMPDGLALLEALGVALPAAESAPFHGIRYVDGEVVADGDFPAASGAGRGPDGFPRPARPAGLGVRRTVLHQALVRRAEAAGVELRWGERVTGLAPAGPEGGSGGGSKLRPEALPGVTTGAGTLRGRFLIGADGLRSDVRRWAGLAGRAPAPADPRARFGVRRHYRLPPWGERVEVHWSDRCEAYVTPVGPELVGVAMLWSGGKASFDELLGRFPALLRRLRGAPAASRDQGCGPLAQRPRAVVRGRIALVGDAGGYLDAITGEGLSLAFHQAFALVETVRRIAAGEARDLAPYERAHRRLRRLPEILIRLLLLTERHPLLRRRAVRALAADPALFERLLGLHAGTLPLSALGATGALRLACRLSWRLASARDAV
jgi:flavin-dependent dehydrogenase